MSRARKKRVKLFSAGWLLLVCGGAACSTADYVPAPHIDCNKVQCSCEQDPQQPTCRGFNGLPEAGPHDGATFDVEEPADATPDVEDGGSDARDGGDGG